MKYSRSFTLTENHVHYNQKSWISNYNMPNNITKSFLVPQKVVVSQQRNCVIKYSKNDGKRLTNEEVPARFYRLHWGVWIHTMKGRRIDLWKMTNYERRIMRQHIMCNAKQSTLLDKMTTKEYKTRKYYIDDPYEAYHEREEFLTTRRKPLPPTCIEDDDDNEDKQ